MLFKLQYIDVTLSHIRIIAPSLAQQLENRVFATDDVARLHLDRILSGIASQSQSPSAYASPNTPIYANYTEESKVRNNAQMLLLASILLKPKFSVSYLRTADASIEANNYAICADEVCKNEIIRIGISGTSTLINVV